jgi:hypothetical protein
MRIPQHWLGPQVEPNFQIFPKMKLVRNLNKLDVVHMVVKMSYTLTSRLTNFSLSSSSSIDDIPKC